MQSIFYSSESRGHANHGWLEARHYFSFAGYHDKNRMHFGALRVLNDDIVAAGYGFDMHQHQNMEIITIPLSGALRHKDSMGTSSVITTGEVQIMSAGKGIFHSEHNPSDTEETRLFQIWIFPDKENIEPQYDQNVFDIEGRTNKIQAVVAPDDANALFINQQSWLSLANIESGKSLEYILHRKGHGVFIINISGKISAEGHNLEKRDAVGIWETDKLNVTAENDSELLFIEVPMKF